MQIPWCSYPKDYKQIIDTNVCTCRDNFHFSQYIKAGRMGLKYREENIISIEFASCVNGG